MGIEGERTVSFNTVVSRQLLHVDDNVDEVPQTSLMEHGSLGLTR